MIRGLLKKLQDCVQTSDMDAPSDVLHTSDTVDVVLALDEAWTAILAIDYRPIFESAVRVLRAPESNHRWR